MLDFGLTYSLDFTDQENFSPKENSENFWLSRSLDILKSIQTDFYRPDNK